MSFGYSCKNEPNTYLGTYGYPGPAMESQRAKEEGKTKNTWRRDLQRDIDKLGLTWSQLEEKQSSECHGE